MTEKDGCVEHQDDQQMVNCGKPALSNTYSFCTTSWQELKLKTRLMKRKLFYKSLQLWAGQAGIGGINSSVYLWADIAVRGIALGCISHHGSSSLSAAKCISDPSKHTPQQQTVTPSPLLTQKVSVCSFLLCLQRRCMKSHPSHVQQLGGNTKVSHLTSASSTRIILPNRNLWLNSFSMNLPGC